MVVQGVEADVLTQMEREEAVDDWEDGERDGDEILRPPVDRGPSSVAASRQRLDPVSVRGDG